MGNFRKLWQKAKEKRATDDVFHKINTKFDHIREKCKMNGFSGLMSTNSGRLGKFCQEAKYKEDLKLDKKIPSDDSGDECLLDEESTNVFSMFTETFLHDKNQDCLEQVLSFLTCKELAASAMTCKTLQHNIFESSDEEVHINMIWHGAEMELVKQHDRLFKVRRFGANAREHCHLFMVASSTAKACERSAKMGEIEEDRMKIDGVLTNLMNVRGFDAEGIAEKKAMAEAATRTDDDSDEDEEEEDEWPESLDVEYYETHDDDGSEDAVNEEDEGPGMDVDVYETHDDDDSENLVNDFLYKRVLQQFTMLSKLEPPENDHKLFVRITRTSTGEVICQGFCEQKQKLIWNAGLEIPFCDRKQGLEIVLDFASLKRSDEVESYLESVSAPVVDAEEEPSNLGFQVTVVVISEKDRSCQCIFQQDQSEDLELVSTSDLGEIGPGIVLVCIRHGVQTRFSWVRHVTVISIFWISLYRSALTAISFCHYWRWTLKRTHPIS